MEDYATGQNKQDEAVASGLWQRLQVEVQAADDGGRGFDYSYLQESTGGGSLRLLA